MKRTKIVTTIGPASDTPEMMEKLMLAGANVFRFNMKHATVEWHEERIARADSVAEKLGINIGILADLQGPEIRLETKNKQDIPVKKGETVKFYSSFSSDDVLLCLPHAAVFDLVKVGELLLIDDGFLEFTVTENKDYIISAVATDDYIIKHRKGVNLPGKDIDLPSLIDADLEKLDLVTRNKVDYIALSFCRRKKDIDVLRAEMKKRNINSLVIAKIESQQSIDNFDEILVAADGIMVGRGDLGIEIPIEELAYWQKQMVSKCRRAGKPVIVATQMLQSMIDNPRPTRAEATDVANAVWDGTDAVMLSAETASGKYPIKSVEAMAKISAFNETKAAVSYLEYPATNQTQAIVQSAIKLIDISASTQPIKALLVFTESGYTARLISSFRPNLPIIGISNNEKTVEELTLSYGVIGLKSDFPDGEFKIPELLLKDLVSKSVLKSGDLILIVHGQHWQVPGTTNSLLLVQA